MYREGQVIARSTPFVHVVTTDKLLIYCSWCFSKTAPLRRCSACKMVCYCSVSCQKSSWQIHKLECPRLAKFAHLPPPGTLRLLFHVLVKFNLGHLDRRETSDGRCFNDLISHADELADTLSRVVDESLKYFPPSMHLPPRSHLQEILGKILINCFYICSEEDFSTQGVALYLNSSKYDHSCLPNAAVSYKGRHQILHALRDISAEEINISYIDTLDTREGRRKKLGHYCFTCQCLRCASDSFDDQISSTLCPVCPGLVSPKDVCLTCARPVDSHYRSKRDLFFSRYRDLITKINNSPEERIHLLSQIEDLLTEWRDYVPPTHVFHTNLHFQKSYLCLRCEDFEGGLKSLEEVFDRLKMILVVSPVLSMVAVEIIKCRAFLELIVDGRFYEEAVGMVRVTHGRESTVMEYLRRFKN